MEVLNGDIEKSNLLYEFWLGISKTGNISWLQLKKNL